MNKTPNITKAIVDHIWSLAEQDMSNEIYVSVKHCVLDYVGVTLAGYRMLSNRYGKRLNQGFSSQGESLVLGSNIRQSVYEASIINGISSHILELDDGHKLAMLHPGGPVLSALFANSNDRRMDDASFVKGVVAGYQTSIILGQMIQPFHKDVGYHSTSTCGTIGAAVGLAVALKFDKEQLFDVLGAASTSVSGILEIQNNQSTLKPFNVGKAAQNAVSAVKAVDAGFKGPDDPIGGKQGFLSIYSNQSIKEHLQRFSAINRRVHILDVYFKKYAACRHAHAPIEAALKLREKCSLKHSDVHAITVKTYTRAIYGHDHTQISNVSSAKMSIPYSVAVSLVSGRAGVHEFMDNTINDKEILELTKKVEVLKSGEADEVFPHVRKASVRITTIKGETMEEEVDYPKGEGSNPFSSSDFKDKFSTLLDYASVSKKTSPEIFKEITNKKLRFTALVEKLKSISLNEERGD